MRTVLVRYKTAHAHADANEALVKAVFEELRQTKPRGLRYASYRFPDGTFVHVATHETTAKTRSRACPRSRRSSRTSRSVASSCRS